MNEAQHELGVELFSWLDLSVESKFTSDFIKARGIDMLDSRLCAMIVGILNRFWTMPRKFMNVLRDHLMNLVRRRGLRKVPRLL